MEIVLEQISGLSRILSRKKLDNKRYLFLPNNFLTTTNQNLITKKLVRINSEIIYPEVWN